jgi:hypothetical protein
LGCGRRCGGGRRRSGGGAAARLRRGGDVRGKVYILQYSRGMGRIFALHDEDMQLVSTSPTTSVLFSDSDGNEM